MNIFVFFFLKKRLIIIKLGLFCYGGGGDK